MRVDSDHWLERVARRPSDNFDARAAGAAIELVVIHGISLPPGQFGGGVVEDFFCNTLDCSIHPTLAELEGVRVSAHVLISRRGKVTQFVAFDRRAWHAGVSSFRGRADCNSMAVGIELEGTDDRPYTDSQYRVLAELVRALFARYPTLSLSSLVGHNEIAPGRKTDPGPTFDWARLYASLAP